jgi:hypothetical protein
MSTELTELLRRYVDLVRPLDPGLIERLRPGATEAEISAAEATFGHPFPDELGEWFTWSNGIEPLGHWPREPIDYLFPWGCNASLADAAAYLDMMNWFHEDIRSLAGVSYSSQRPGMHRAGYPIVIGLDHEWMVECEPGDQYGMVWGGDIQDNHFIAFRTVTDFMHRNVHYAERGWLIKSRFGGIKLAPAAQISGHPEEELYPNWYNAMGAWAYDPETNDPPLDHVRTQPPD